jgi:hypothetical protein
MNSPGSGPDSDGTDDYSGNRVRPTTAIKQGSIESLVNSGMKQEQQPWSEEGVSSSSWSEGGIGMESRSNADVPLPDANHGLELAAFGAIFVFGVSAVAAIVYVVRRRRVAVPPARKGDTHGDYVAVEMQPTAQGEDDFGLFAAVGNVEDLGAASESQALKSWDDGDGWDEFDSLDESRALPTLTGYDSNGVKALLDLELGEQGGVNIMVTFKSSSSTDINPFSCK